MRLCRVVTAIIPSPNEWMMRCASCNQAIPPQRCQSVPLRTAWVVHDREERSTDPRRPSNLASDLLELPTSDCFASLVDDWNALITASPIP